MIGRQARQVSVLGAFTLVLAAVGCTSPGAGPSEPPEPVYLERTSPANVLENLVTSYEEMNLEEYLDCLSFDFVFYPNEDDVTNDPDIPMLWYKDVEENVHANMFSEVGLPNLQVDHIDLVLTSVSSETLQGADPLDPLDDIVVHNQAVDLRVYLRNGSTYLADSPSRFLFRVDPERHGRDGELLWRICEWYDLTEIESPARDGRRESTSWGGLKATFMSDD